MGKNPKQRSGANLSMKRNITVIPRIVLLFPQRTCQFSAKGRENEEKNISQRFEIDLLGWGGRIYHLGLPGRSGCEGEEEIFEN